MKRFTLFLLYLLLFSGTGHTHERVITLHDFATQLEEYRIQHRGLEMVIRMHIRMFWDVNLAGIMAFGVLDDSEFCSALGISDEQWQEIQINRIDAVKHLFSKNPEWQEIQQSFEKIAQPLLESGGLHSADEETIYKLSELQDKSSAMFRSVLFHPIDNGLTSGQAQKINEMLLVSAEKFSMISPSAFEALDLTDVQRQEMKRIKKELEPEFEKYLEEIRDCVNTPVKLLLMCRREICILPSLRL